LTIRYSGTAERHLAALHLAFPERLHLRDVLRLDWGPRATSWTCPSKKPGDIKTSDTAAYRRWAAWARTTSMPSGGWSGLDGRWAR